MADSAFATLKLQVAAAPQGKLEFESWGFPKTFSDDHSSLSRLSAKGLEVCTENLGSETGSDVVAADCSGIFAASAASSDQENPCTDGGRERSRSSCSGRKTKQRNHEATKPTPRRFPPPLTTMSGSNSLQVRRRREDGRLIIEAVETPFINPYLKAERSDGRLRLRYLTDSNDSGSESPAAVDTEEAGDEAESEGETTVERIQRWSRCKERRHDNEGLCNNWKPALWVATS